jgi:hypothetical protein
LEKPAKTRRGLKTSHSGVTLETSYYEFKNVILLAIVRWGSKVVSLNPLKSRSHALDVVFGFPNENDN